MENNSYNKSRQVCHDDYSDGYDPKAIEYARYLHDQFVGKK